MTNVNNATFKKSNSAVLKEDRQTEIKGTRSQKEVFLCQVNEFHVTEKMHWEELRLAIGSCESYLAEKPDVKVEKLLKKLQNVLAFANVAYSNFPELPAEVDVTANELDAIASTFNTFNWNMEVFVTAVLDLEEQGAGMKNHPIMNQLRLKEDPHTRKSTRMNAIPIMGIERISRYESLLDAVNQNLPPELRQIKPAIEGALDIARNMFTFTVELKWGREIAAAPEQLKISKEESKALYVTAEIIKNLSPLKRSLIENFSVFYEIKVNEKNSPSVQKVAEYLRISNQNALLCLEVIQAAKKFEVKTPGEMIDMMCGVIPGNSHR